MIFTYLTLYRPFAFLLTLSAVLFLVLLKAQVLAEALCIPELRILPTLTYYTTRKGVRLLEEYGYCLLFAQTLYEDKEVLLKKEVYTCKAIQVLSFRLQAYEA